MESDRVLNEWRFYREALNKESRDLILKEKVAACPVKYYPINRDSRPCRCIHRFRYLTLDVLINTLQSVYIYIYIYTGICLVVIVVFPEISIKSVSYLQLRAITYRNNRLSVRNKMLNESHALKNLRSRTTCTKCNVLFGIHFTRYRRIHLTICVS